MITRRLSPLSNKNNAIRCSYGIADPRDEHVIDVHVKANMKTVDIRSKKQVLTCIWSNIKKGIIETPHPITQNRSAGSPSIYLPIPRTVLF